MVKIGLTLSSIIFSNSAFAIHTHSLYEDDTGIKVCIEDPSFGGEFLEFQNQRMALEAIEPLTKYTTLDGQFHLITRFRHLTLRDNMGTQIGEVKWKKSGPGRCF